MESNLCDTAYMVSIPIEKTPKNSIHVLLQRKQVELRVKHSCVMYVGICEVVDEKCDHILRVNEYVKTCTVEIELCVSCLFLCNKCLEFNVIISRITS